MDPILMELLIGKALDLTMLYLANDPEAEKAFNAGVETLKRAKAEGRELTNAELGAIVASRKRLVAGG